ncbi:glycosyltransferase family 4 protein [Phragmitibacter flavus]|uniref:Glycosyltransferase family 4 protein n=1 Tax=Phragmitibacter flavus TaxID=2576071 RepID=A0A5R8KDV0_9BACT|nr:glycosyltransferase family 4 protein [Phragmitibacter flavus]TLD70437.1 glycosyltransferase family 4 protein [Phragmitibacter flavus]
MERLPHSFAVFTIVSTNYLGRALVMHDSLKRHHPEMSFWLLLIDDSVLGSMAENAVKKRNIRLLRVPEIGLPAGEVANFRMIYDLTEVATAYKPWTMETVARLSGMNVFYIDPDIEFFAPINSLLESVERHELALTPHVLTPMMRDHCQPSESDIMGSGIYNLGFLGMNQHAASKVASWWCERLLRECYSAPSQQRFTDQRWMDFAPCFFDCFISKDETFNVAYWNTDQRHVEAQNGGYLVNGKPLSFFHYSGLDERAPHLLTKHHAGEPRVLLSNQPGLLSLTQHYLAEIQSAQHECSDTTAEYPYNYFPGGGLISREIRRLFLKELVRAEKAQRTPPPSPFGLHGEKAFVDWANELLPAEGSHPRIPRLALLLRDTREDLKAEFGDPSGADATRLVEWMRKDGVKQFALNERLIPQALDTQRELALPTLVPGLEIVGYLHTESGVGQAARLLTQGLANSTLSYATLVDSSPNSRQRASLDEHRETILPHDQAFDCCVLCVNADRVAETKARLGSDYFRNRRTVGLWFWEVEHFPKALHAAFREVEEVWVATEFIRNILTAISPVPVHCIPLPFGVPETIQVDLDRKAMGIPEGFFFYFSFDFHSIFRRKNPIGLIQAFKLAFPPEEGPTLVIKCINGESHLAELEQLRHASRDRQDIIILSGYLDVATNQALTAACGCYISLHRSEGLGLTMAEAMRHERPVIATAYSGNMEFMNDRNSYLCRFEMTPVGIGSAPYSPTATWAEPNLQHAASLMRQVYNNPEEATHRGRIAARELAERFSLEKCASAVQARYEQLCTVTEREAIRFVPTAPKGSGFSAQLRALHKQWKRPLNIVAAVPSFGTLLFQGPRKILLKMLRRVDRHRRKFDEAVVEAMSSHDQRLAKLERELAKLDK